MCYQHHVYAVPNGGQKGASEPLGTVVRDHTSAGDPTWIFFLHEELVLLTTEPCVRSLPQSSLRIRLTCYNWEPRPCPVPYLTTGCLREVWLTIPHCTLAGWPCLPYHGLSHLASVLQQALLPVWSPHTVCAWARVFTQAQHPRWPRK